MYYPGDDYYSSAVAYSNFTIYKMNSTVSIDDINPVEIENGIKITIRTNNIEITNETIIVRINGELIKENITKNIVGGVMVFTVDVSKDKLNAAGEYIVTAYINETYTYNSNSTSKYFTVYKHASEFNPLVITPVKVVYGHNVTIGLSMKDKHGYTLNSTNVTLRIADKDYIVGIDEEGRGNLTLNLPVDNYTVVVSFAGNDKYNASASASALFSVVDKNVTGVVVLVNNTEVENAVVININTNNTEVSKENISVLINGVEHAVEGSNGSFTVTIAKESVAGNYTVSVTVAETEWYYSAVNSTNYTVYKHAAVIDQIIVPSADTIINHNITIEVVMVM